MNSLPVQLFIQYGLPCLGANLLVALVISIYCVCQQGFRQSFSGLDWWGDTKVAVVFLLLVTVIWPYAFYRTFTYGKDA